MRLTLVISSLERGGAERVMSVLASAWAQQGKEVTLLTLDSEEIAYPLHHSVRLRNLRLHSKTTISQMGKMLGKVSRIPVLRRAILESQPDLVISFIDRPNILTLIATRGLGIPVVVSERTNPAAHKIGVFWSNLRRLFYPCADALVCQTSSALAWFQSRMNLRTEVIPNPVTLPNFLHPKKLNIPGPRILLALGRLHAYKGFDLLLRAWALISNEHPDWLLKIVGDGPQGDDLQAQARDLGLTERVQFVSTVSDPFPELRNADLFVLSSRFEGFPNALCEAMACGVPAISFDCPWGPSDIIRDGVDGILAPPEDVSSLAAALERLVADPQLRATLAARAPDVLERFSMEKILESWEKIFAMLLSSSSTGLHS